ncbi:MAG: hypothetical protein ACOY8P_09560 [Thermodesulfobacteriota bacterium]
MSARVNVAPPLASWKSYEYFEGGHNYPEVRYEPAGGPEGQPCIWADDSLWTIDTPEQPHSILFLLHYRFWDYEAPADLREMTLRCRLRGENLKLHGAKVSFWVVTYGPAATRWHYAAEPLPVSHEKWGDPVTVTLRNDPALWHRSFAAAPDKANNLNQTLGACFSCGFAFVGFSEKVTGRIALSEFCLEGVVDPCWPFTASIRRWQPDWLTVSGREGRQVPVPQPDEASSFAICLENDYCVVPHPVPFVYLAFIRAAATGYHDLRRAVLMVWQQEERLNLQGGKVAFFVEHTASETRWILRRPLEYFGTEPWSGALIPDESLWLRLSGHLPLERILAGGEGQGYDYLGLMVVGCQQVPSGTWKLLQFSVGPALATF